MNGPDSNIRDNILTQSALKQNVEQQAEAEIMKMINCPSLLTGMSHEMRTHMNSIMAFSFLLNKGGLNENEKEEFSNHILSSCEQLMYLFDNFLDSAIIDTGSSKAELVKCRINEILDELLADFRVILKREDHKDLVLILENQFSDQEEVYLDSFRVIRVIRSLFYNALNSTKSGYIKIGYCFKEDDLVFYLLDSGDGFQKCDDFLKTQNLNESLGRHNDASSAINLTLARKLVNLMGGRIWVDPNGPAGTAIYFSVPAKGAGKQKFTLNKYLNSKMAI
jgi:K+-sensing histidine kinase KdpD